MLVILFWPISGKISVATGEENPHEQIARILQQPAYQQWRLREPNAEGKVPELPERFGGWGHRLLEAVEKFFRWLFPQHKNAPGSESRTGWGGLPSFLSTVIVLAVVIIIGSLLFLLYRSTRASAQSMLATAILGREQVDAALEAGDALALQSGQWLDEARRLAAEQNFRAVYRALYLALLSGLHTTGKIEHSRNRTNWTYVQQFRGSGEERETFRELTHLFDRVWYGRKTAAESTMEQVRAKVATLITGARA